MAEDVNSNRGTYAREVIGEFFRVCDALHLRTDNGDWGMLRFAMPKQLRLSFGVGLMLLLSHTSVLAQTRTTTAAPATAIEAQPTTPRVRSRALVGTANAMVGFLGGAYTRGMIEYQMHSRPQFAGHALGLGLGAAWWPNLGGASVTVAARYHYDQQLAPGTRFYVSPYVGMEAGIAIVANKQALAGVRVAAFPMGGLELRFLWDRWVLGFRPVGFLIPVFVGEPQRGGPPIQWDILWDTAVTFGGTL